MEFYTLALEFLREGGRWSHGLSPQFIPVSDWAQLHRGPGGKNNVRKAVKTLTEAGLNGMVSGIVDLDQGEIEERNVYVLSRYAIENYLLDPIVIYAFLLDRDKAPPIDFEIRPGEVAKLAELSNDELQHIVNAVLRLYEPAVREELGKDLAPETREVVYSNGRSVAVPLWLLTEKGHRLFNALSRITEAARSHEEVWKAFKRVRLVPVELREVFEKAIGCSPVFAEQEELPAGPESHFEGEAAAIAVVEDFDDEKVLTLPPAGAP